MKELQSSGYRVRYNDNKIECIPESGVVDKEDIEEALNDMKDEASSEFSRQPAEIRYRFAYDYLCKKYADLQRRNGVVAPSTREIEMFAGGIVEKIRQEYEWTGK